MSIRFINEPLVPYAGLGTQQDRRDQIVASIFMRARMFLRCVTSKQVPGRHKHWRPPSGLLRGKCARLFMRARRAPKPRAGINPLANPRIICEMSETAFNEATPRAQRLFRSMQMIAAYLRPVYDALVAKFIRHRHRDRRARRLPGAHSEYVSRGGGGEEFEEPLEHRAPRDESQLAAADVRADLCPVVGSRAPTRLPVPNPINSRSGRERAATAKWPKSIRSDQRHHTIAAIGSHRRPFETF
ncbi:unnamed protein product, partial [Iphiclides podalirius]